MGIFLLEINPAQCFCLTPWHQKTLPNTIKRIHCLAQNLCVLLESQTWTLPKLHFQEGCVFDTGTEGTFLVNWAWHVAVPFGWDGAWVVVNHLWWLWLKNWLLLQMERRNLWPEKMAKHDWMECCASLFHSYQNQQEILGTVDKRGRTITDSLTHRWLPTFIPYLGLQLVKTFWIMVQWPQLLGPVERLADHCGEVGD